jgi:hypothetical protein
METDAKVWYVLDNLLDYRIWGWYYDELVVFCFIVMGDLLSWVSCQT